MKVCRHVWDFLKVIWVNSERAHPCKRCDALFVVGNILLNKNGGLK